MDELQQGLVDLVGMGPGDRVRAACYADEAAVPEQRGEPDAGGLGGQDAVLVALEDKDGNVDSVVRGIRLLPWESGPCP